MLDRIRRRDAESWDRFVKLYRPLVGFWLRDANLADHDRDDLVNEVFQAVVQHVDSFRNNQPGATFRGWLRTITRNKLIDFYRRQVREPAGEGGSTALERLQQIPADNSTPATTEPEHADEESVLLQRAMKLLQQDFEPRSWQAFWRTVIDGETTADVAAALGMTSAAVRKARSRVLQRLRAEFGELLS
ncbi:MAG TPA: sigma-70 family RNA polymerase sigma factor [Pirellulales bacterium]|nr:sigma-70 family RNA polymerase sigma factor [Pirellulales bacterium]